MPVIIPDLNLDLLYTCYSLNQTSACWFRVYLAAGLAAKE